MKYRFFILLIIIIGIYYINQNDADNSQYRNLYNYEEAPDESEPERKIVSTFRLPSTTNNAVLPANSSSNNNSRAASLSLARQQWRDTNNSQNNQQYSAASNNNSPVFSGSNQSFSLVSWLLPHSQEVAILPYNA